MSKFIDYYLPNLAIGFYKKFDYEDVKQLLNVWQVKQLFGQSISATDLFGGFTAYTCFESKKELCHQVHLSDQRRLVKKGVVPCPIYTMVSGETDRAMVWYECTPWEIGSADFGTYVPSWAFGRTFNNGVSINNAPEQSLGYLLGLFNSVWAATLKETYDHAFFELLPHYKTRSIQTMWQQMISMRLVKSELPNFTYQLAHSPLKNQYHMQFVDAGVAFDMPYPPISGARAERAADVIIFCNVSVPVKELSRFDEAQQYAAQHGVQLPQLYTEGINNSVVTVFEDNNACNVPTVIYMPRIFDEKLWQKNRWRKECAPYRGMLDDFDLLALNVINTTCVHPKNFAVPEKDSRRLVAMVQFNMQMSMPAIIAAINNVIDKHAAA